MAIEKRFREIRAALNGPRETRRAMLGFWLFFVLFVLSAIVIEIAAIFLPTHLWVLGTGASLLGLAPIMGGLVALSGWNESAWRYRLGGISLLAVGVWLAWLIVKLTMSIVGKPHAV